MAKSPTKKASRSRSRSKGPKKVAFKNCKFFLNHEFMQKYGCSFNKYLLLLIISLLTLDLVLAYLEKIFKYKKI